MTTDDSSKKNHRWSLSNSIEFYEALSLISAGAIVGGTLGGMWNSPRIPLIAGTTTLLYAGVMLYREGGVEALVR